MLSREIGDRIRGLRESHNYTREAFAEKVNISSKFLYEIESGKKGFSAETLLNIANAFSVSCDYILTGYEGNKIIEQIDMILAGFNESQIRQVREILALIQGMCTK